MRFRNLHKVRMSLKDGVTAESQARRIPGLLRNFDFSQTLNS